MINDEEGYSATIRKIKNGEFEYAIYYYGRAMLDTKTKVQLYLTQDRDYLEGIVRAHMNRLLQVKKTQDTFPKGEWTIVL